MSKLNSLIKGQKISFDTHQAGDGQETKWRNVHLEKSIIGEKGKVRFPFLGEEKASNSGMTDKNFDSVVKEVSKVLKKNKELLADLGKEIEAQLERFSGGMATVEDAKQAAKRFANYFDLNPTFIDQVSTYRESRLTQFKSIHVDDKSGKNYAIKQSDKSIIISERKTSSFNI